MTQLEPLAPVRFVACDAPPVADVTVCIANWNGRDILRRCLESLHRRPQGAVVETVVVDNDSTDGAADMVAREFPEVVLVRNADNRGFARASNQAADRGHGRYLLFLNNDTIVPDHALGRLIAFAERNPRAGLIGPRLRDEAGGIQISYRRRPSIAALLHRTVVFRWTGLFSRAYRAYRRGAFDPNYQGPVDLLMGAAVLMPRAVYEAGGRWDEEFAFGGEDLELSARIGRRHQVLFAPDIEITHLGRVSSRLNVGYMSENLAIGYVKYLRKTGSSEWALRGYKLAVTLDTPLQLVAVGVRGLWRAVRGKRTKAGKSRLAMRGMVHFLTRSLGRFWRA